MKGFSKAAALIKGIPRPALALAAIAVIAGFLFWGRIAQIASGLVLVVTALAAILAAVLVLAKLRYGEPGLKKLFAEKERLLEELRIAEQRYIKRKLSEEDFNRIFKEKQERLIALEATIDEQYNRESKSEIDESLLAVQTKKRHILKSLLEEKRRLVKAIDIAESRYLKRKIDSKTYQELVQQNQKKLIELEAQIKALYREANVSKVMDSLKSKLSEIENQKKRMERERQMSDREALLKIAREVSDQMLEK